MVTIGGFQPLSLCDFPGTPAAVIFLQGCNWRCRYCHNPSLLPMKGATCFSEEEILTRLRIRKRLLRGVVVTGGEPTLQKDLHVFMQKIRDIGLKIKLDTNGSKPNHIATLIKKALLDYIAMDIKAPWSKYETIAGCHIDLYSIRQSIGIISSSSLPHQFRTTYPPHLLTKEDLDSVRKQAPLSSPHIVLKYRQQST